MKSSLKIAFIDTSAGMQPCIRVRKSKNLDDARDGILYNFFEKLGGDSSWLKVEFRIQNEEEDFINIFPVTPRELPFMIEEAAKRLPAKKGSREVSPFIPNVNLALSSVKLAAGQLGIKYANIDMVDVCPGDLIMDENLVIGRATEAGKDTIWMQPVNVTAFSVEKHFTPGTTARIIQRTLTEPFSHFTDLPGLISDISEIGVTIKE